MRGTRTPKISGSQSTIKMDKGYHRFAHRDAIVNDIESQSTIKMDKGYHRRRTV